MALKNVDHKKTQPGCAISGLNFGILGYLAEFCVADANHNGRACGMTQSAVSDGAIIVHDRANQQQNVDTLARDIIRVYWSYPLPLTRIKRRRACCRSHLIGEIGNQVAGIARRQGEIAGEKTKRDPAALIQAHTEPAATDKPLIGQNMAGV
ncbi:hypothetical protein AAGU66_13355 [Edwardsiella ictaluri]|uniref:hypothetical protein n=1 Tax=Edwardsiella ictaluri TaxID=67780 RepID=UPI0010571BC2|nr:hypothetical protein [Edwardsiella ictaluri]EKS7764798.1 hypothetical protein [Edwardsiella ictaluri]EKS7771699.1 hypothetical protein [Edwardsiella ictaluri]EKS7774879.1 hypothetical protein [Edwardsiella ictaluri]EKS7778174.1 hypothetical protein [Edwardsiella ictaluri]EKS7788199.1 hypothetical protein [Edwardsiella ictaluri]